MTSVSGHTNSPRYLTEIWNEESENSPACPWPCTPSSPLPSWLGLLARGLLTGGYQLGSKKLSTPCNSPPKMWRNTTPEFLLACSLICAPSSPFSAGLPAGKGLPGGRQLGSRKPSRPWVGESRSMSETSSEEASSWRVHSCMGF